MKYSIIYSGDYDFQVLHIATGKNCYYDAWDIAEEMERDGQMKEIGVEYYSVVEFQSLQEMNEWILDQVKEGRQILHPEKK